MTIDVRRFRQTGDGRDTLDRAIASMPHPDLIVVTIFQKVHFGRDVVDGILNEGDI